MFWFFGHETSRILAPQPENKPTPPEVEKVSHSVLTLGDPMDCSPPGSSVHGILWARILSGLPFPSPGDLPNPGIKPRSPALQGDSLPTEPPGKPWKAKR